MATEEREEQSSEKEKRKGESRELESRRKDGGGERPPLRPVALRGAAGGAAAGAVVGAAVAVARALRPEQAEAAQRQLVSAGRDIGTAAVRAAGGVLTAKPVSDLIAGKSRGDGDRSETMKQAAKEAGVAAATAARRALVSMRDESELNGK